MTIEEEHPFLYQKGDTIGSWLRRNEVSFGNLPPPRLQEGIYFRLAEAPVCGEPLESLGAEVVYFNISTGRPAKEFLIYSERELEESDHGIGIRREIREYAYLDGVGYHHPLLQKEIPATEVEVRIWRANERWRKTKRTSAGGPFLGGLTVFTVTFDPNWCLDISGQPQFLGKAGDPNVLGVSHFESVSPGELWIEEFREVCANGDFVSYARRGNEVMRLVRFQNLFRNTDGIPERLSSFDIPSELGPARRLKF